MTKQMQQLVVTEFEMGSNAALVDLLTKQTSKLPYSKLITKLKSFVSSMFVIRGNTLHAFNLVSIVKVTKAEYPCEVSFVFYYEEK